ncbi:MAG: tetratricopeptide repeat protein [Deltaproteobacteria bacterium]|nr:tetratricopeptide repeat protein [Deltaproteobacteria bacterium]
MRNILKAKQNGCFCFRSKNMAAGALTVLYFCLLPVSSLAGKQEDPRLKRAENLLQYGEYGDAISQLVELLYPVRLDRREDANKARELLGVCYFYVGDLDKSRYEFIELLKMDPNHHLDPLLYPPPLVEFFDSIRTEIAEELKRIKEERLAEERKRKKKEEARKKAAKKAEKVYIERHSKKNSLPLVFVPFGVGQFQNNDLTKGFAVLGGETALLALNIISYHVIVGLKNPDGTIPSRDMELAKGMRVTQMASLGALLVLIVYGVVDAWINFKPYEVELSPLGKEVSDSTGHDKNSSLSRFILQASWRF